MSTAKWRPMSTAPRDGFHFLGRISVRGIPTNVAQVYWDAADKRWKYGYCPTCEMFCGDFVDINADVIGWLPLPGEEDRYPEPQT